MAFNRPDPNASLADYKEHAARKQPMGKTKPKEHLAQKRTKIDKAIANAQAFQKQRTALINMSTKDKLGSALEASIVGAATGGGIIAAQKGIRAAVNSGIPARVSNMVKGEIVVVHGSPTQGLKVINPTQGLNRRGTRAVDLGKQGFFEIPKPNTVNQGGNIAKNYALPDKLGNVPEGKVGGGSIYIAKTKKTGLVQEGYIGYTPNPSPVVSEIRLSNIPEKNIQLYFDKYEKAIKKAGGPQLPRAIKKEIKTFQKQQSKLPKKK